MALCSVSEANLRLIDTDPAAVWLILEDEDAYFTEKKRRVGLWNRILGRGPSKQNTAKPEINAPHVCDLDKSWHAIHFLLCHNDGQLDSDSSFLLHKGQHLCDVMIDYSPPDYRAPAMVAAFDAVVRNVDGTELWRRFDTDELNSYGIYPEGHWSGDQDDFEYITENYESLREFVSAASKRGDGVVIRAG